MTAVTLSCVMGCVVPRSHASECSDPECRGCRPREAAEGLRVCDWHEDSTREALRDLPDLWASAGDPRTSGVGRYGGSDEARLPLSDGRVWSRDAIRRMLDVWCDILSQPPYNLTVPTEQAIAAGSRQLYRRHQEQADELRQEAWRNLDEAHELLKGDGGPEVARQATALRAGAANLRRSAYRARQAAQALRDEREAGTDVVRALAEHVERQLGRILAGDDAEQLVSDLFGSSEEAAGIEKPGVVRPAQRAASSGRRAVSVECPSCGGRVPLEADVEGWITCRACGERGVLDWWRTWVAPPGEPACAAKVCTWLQLHHRIELRPATLRKWASRGWVAQVGTDTAGRPTYDPVDVAAVAIRRREETTA